MSSKITRSSASSIWIERLWHRVVSPAGLGGLLLAAGLIFVVGPLNMLPKTPPTAWWSIALQAEGMARGGASLLAMAVVLMSGLGLVRWRTSRGDIAEVDPDGPGAGRTNHIAAIGAGLMVLGAAIGTLMWVVAGSQVAASRVSLPVGKSIESYPAITVSGNMRVMLPSRLKVRSVNVDEGTAELELSKVGDEGVVQSIRVGRPVDIDGMRYALVGIEFDPRVVRAVVAGSTPDTIATSAAVGESFRVTLDGPEYRVTQLIRDYLNVLGPAVEVENEETGRFWLFQRSNPIEGFQTPHGLRLEALETAPVVILGVSRRQPTEVFGSAGVLFFLGLGLFLFGRDRLYGKATKGEGVWSLNDAHSIEEGA